MVGMFCQLYQEHRFELCPSIFLPKKIKTNRGGKFQEKKVVRVGNMDATLILRCLSEPESEAGLRSVKISGLAQKLTEIATFFQSGAISNLT